VPLLFWLWKAPYGPRFRTGEHVRPRTNRGLADIIETARAISSNRIIVSMVLLAGTASLFISNAYQAQMPEFGRDLGHGDPDVSYSALLGADAAGALTAGLVLEARGLLQPSARTAFILAMLWCCALAAFALSTSYALALVLLFGAGFLELSFNAMAQSLVQLHAPAAIRGRVIGLYSVAALGLRTVSGLTVGIAGGFIGIHASLSISAIVLLIILAVLFVALAPQRATPEGSSG
jgi:MFS family permease